MSRRHELIGTVLGLTIVVGVVLGMGWAYLPVKVTGGSMHPTLHTGDLVLVRRTGTVTVGDIALIAPIGRARVLHRVVGVETEGALRMRGDANPIDDLAPVAPTDVAGRVVLTVPLGAYVARWRRLGCCDTLTAQSDSAQR